jgi:hypothetical protein
MGRSIASQPAVPSAVAGRVIHTEIQRRPVAAGSMAGPRGPVQVEG